MTEQLDTYAAAKRHLIDHRGSNSGCKECDEARWTMRRFAMLAGNVDDPPVIADTPESDAE